MKTKILGIAIVAFVLFSSAALAQPREVKRDRNRMSPEKRALIMKRNRVPQDDRSGFFTEEQMESIKQMRLETAKKVKPFKNKLRELQAHQQTLTTSDKADMKAINKNIDEITEVKAEIAKAAAKQHQDIRALLSEEQLLKFDNFRHRKRSGKVNFIKQRSGRGKNAPPNFGT